MGSLNYPVLRRQKNSRAQESIILLTICLTPFLGAVEVLDLLRVDLGILGIESWMLKILKDVFILLSISIGLFFGYFRSSAASGVSIFFALIIIPFSIWISVLSVGVEAAASGLRWLLPLVFYLTLKSFDKAFFDKLSVFLFCILCVGLVIQVYQYFYMSGFYGETSLGFSLRNPGFYLIPSSMAAYAMTTLFFVACYNGSKLILRLAYFLVGLSVLLTASGTGYISFLMFILFAIGKRERFAGRILAILSIGFAVFLLLPIITNREDILSSPLTRLDIFIEHLDPYKIFFSNTFGVGTNTFINLKPDFLDSGEAIIADSMVNSSAINLGLVFVLLLVYEIFIRVLVVPSRTAFLFLSAFAPFYLTIILFELFPVNILMMIALSDMLLRRKNINIGNLQTIR